MLRGVIWIYIGSLWYPFHQTSDWILQLNLPRKASDPREDRPATASANDSSELSDEELVGLCLAKGTEDNRPFKELFRRHQASVWRHCFRFVRDSQDAEDLTQDVFFKAFRKLGQFKGRSSFKTWLHRIAINTGQNELRRRMRRPQISQTSLETLAEILPTTSTPETRRLELARQERLAQTLARLSPEQAQVLQLKDLDQRPYTEVAQALGVKLSAAKMRVQRARLALQLIYRQSESEEELI